MPAGVPEDRRHHRPERLVRGLGQPVGPPRRLVPVLAVLVVRIGRRAHGDAAGEAVLERPGVGPETVDPDGQIGHHPEAHAGAQARLVRRRQLLVQQPLQPAVEVDLALVGGPEGRDARGRPDDARLRASPSGPARRSPTAPPRWRSRAGPALPAAVGRQRLLPAGGPRDGEDHLQRGSLRRPGRVPVDPLDQLGRSSSSAPAGLAPRHAAPRGGRVLRDAFRPQIERVGEPPAGRQVRRRLHRRPGSAACSGLIKHVVRPVFGGRPDRQILEVGEIADRPGLARPDAVQLRGQTPTAAAPHPLGQAEPGRGDDQRHGRRCVAAAGVQGVVAERQVGRDLEGRLAHPAAVDVAGRRPVLQLPQTAARLRRSPARSRSAPGHRG